MLTPVAASPRPSETLERHRGLDFPGPTRRCRERRWTDAQVTMAIAVDAKRDTDDRWAAPRQGWVRRLTLTQVLADLVAALAAIGLCAVTMPAQWEGHLAATGAPLAHDGGCVCRLAGAPGDRRRLSTEDPQLRQRPVPAGAQLGRAGDRDRRGHQLLPRARSVASPRGRFVHGHLRSHAHRPLRDPSCAASSSSHRRGLVWRHRRGSSA